MAAAFGGGVDTSAAQTFTISVTPVNDAPVITSSSAASVVENGASVATVTATDIDSAANALTYSISGGTDASKFQIDGSTGALSFKTAPDFDVPGDANGDNQYEVDVQVSDGTDSSAPQSITVTVAGINDIAPVLALIDQQSVVEGKTLTVNLSATDVEGAPLVLSATGLPGFATFTDHGDGTGTIQFAPGFLDTGAYPITVRATDSGSLSDEETFSLVVGNVAPTVNLTGPASVVESNASFDAAYDITLSHASELPVSVSVQVQDGSATAADQDFNPLDQIVTFNPGDPLTKQVLVTIRGDNKFELNENFQVVLESATNGTIGVGAVTTVIENDDSLPTLIIRDASALERSASSLFDMFFQVELSNPNSQPITVNYATADGSATTADGDYDSTAGSLTFNPGSTAAQAIGVVIRGDAKFEQDQDFFLNLTSASGAAIADGQGRGTILNDDSRPTISVGDATPVTEGNLGTVPAIFTITLSNPTDETVTVNASTADGTATVADGDYAGFSNQLVTFAPGQTSRQVTVNINGDAKAESNETFTLSLARIIHLFSHALIQAGYRRRASLRA